MALAHCRECGKEVSTEATACPHCGAPRPGLTIDTAGSVFHKPPPQTEVSAPTPHASKEAETEASYAITRRRPVFSPMMGVLALGGSLVVLIVAWGLFMQTGNRSPSSTMISAQPPQPPAAPVVGRLGAAQRQAASEALDILQGLQSVTAAGITYRDYAPRVLDAKVAIDRYLATHGTDNQVLAGSIERATALYVLASLTWNVSVRTAVANNSYEAQYEAQQFIHAGRERAAQLCPDVIPTWDDALLPKIESGYVDTGGRLKYSLPVIWRCASNALAEAMGTLRSLP